MYSPRSVLGSSRKANTATPAGQVSPYTYNTNITLKPTPKPPFTKINTNNHNHNHAPTGKENRRPPISQPTPSRAYSHSPGLEYTVSTPPRSRCATGEHIPREMNSEYLLARIGRHPPPPPRVTTPKPDNKCSCIDCADNWPASYTYGELLPVLKFAPSWTCVPFSPPASPSPSPPCSLPLYGRTSLYYAIVSTQYISPTNAYQWNTQFVKLDALHAKDVGDEYWDWRAEKFRERESARREERLKIRKRDEERRAGLMKILNGELPSSMVKPEKLDDTPVHQRAVDERTMAGFFPPFGYGTSDHYGLEEGYNLEPVEVYMIPTPAEKYAYTSESWLSSSLASSSSSSSTSSTSDNEVTLANTSLPYSDISVSPTIDVPASPNLLSSKLFDSVPPSPTFPSLAPAVDVFTYSSTHESRREELRDHMIKLFAARTKQFGLTCDDVDQADYSDDGCESSSEDGAGGMTGWADDELTPSEGSQIDLYDE